MRLKCGPFTGPFRGPQGPQFFGWQKGRFFGLKRPLQLLKDPTKTYLLKVMTKWSGVSFYRLELSPTLKGALL